jgi:hypothetical protein
LGNHIPQRLPPALPAAICIWRQETKRDPFNLDETRHMSCFRQIIWQTSIAVFCSSSLAAMIVGRTHKSQIKAALTIRQRCWCKKRHCEDSVFLFWVPL